MAWRLHRSETRTCVECHKYYATRTPMKKTCSPECARAQKTRKARQARDARRVQVGLMSTAWYNARRKADKN